MGLSSNVLNMKFMKNAQDNTQNESQQPESKKVKDLSEWLLPAHTIRPKTKPIVTVRSVGYGSIASLTAKDDDAESKDSTEVQTASPPKNPECKKNDAQAFVNEILNTAQKDKKRLQKQEKRLRKKARSLLS